MTTMAPDASRPSPVQHVATAGTALAVALVPLAVGMLLARTMAADPLTPVNAMVTRGGRQVLVAPAQWRGCGRDALRRWKRAPSPRDCGRRARSALRHTVTRRTRRTAPVPGGR